MVVIYLNVTNRNVTQYLLISQLIPYSMIKQESIHVCLQCGCVFSIQGIGHEARCPVCKGKDFDRIQGFDTK